MTEPTEAFDTIMASLDSPMAVVTTALDGERAGCLIGFQAQSSIDPRRYCLWLSKANHTYRVALRSRYLGVHLLTETDADHDLARRFGTLTGDEVDKFAGLAVTTEAHDVPLLDSCSNRLVVRRIALLDEGGDHVCITTEPIGAETSGPFRPLRLSAVSHLVPGHRTDERPVPPTLAARS
ncbi:MAG: flavin reductase family protein [Actinomycetota bacterium]|nr:flavin reductase family protein [Actinomycetota bacterium]